MSRATNIIELFEELNFENLTKAELSKYFELSGYNRKYMSRKELSELQRLRNKLNGGKYSQLPKDIQPRRKVDEPKPDMYPVGSKPPYWYTTPDNPYNPTKRDREREINYRTRNNLS